MSGSCAVDNGTPSETISSLSANQVNLSFASVTGSVVSTLPVTDLLSWLQAMIANELSSMFV